MLSILIWLKRIVKKWFVGKSCKRLSFRLEASSSAGITCYVIKGRMGLMLYGMPIGNTQGIRLIQRREAADQEQFDKLLSYYLGEAKVEWE